MMIEITPRKPVKEERELMYQSGFDPTECEVAYRLHGIMTIYRKTDGTIHRIDERKHKEVP